MMNRHVLKLLLLLLVLAAAASAKPNIIFVLLDDAGWYDFQSHDPTMWTPNIKRLREEGLFLDQSYANPSCAPSRAALLTGRYPRVSEHSSKSFFRTYAHTFGAQNGKALSANTLNWVDKSLSMISNEMKELNYKTHALGKWHMGLCHPSLTPMGRGFDTFYGLLCGAHFSYSIHAKSSRQPSYDWWDNGEIDIGDNGTFSTELLSNRMVEIIKTSKKRDPFFAYLAFPAPHGPFEVPEPYIEKYCPDVGDRDRQVHCGMLAAVDEGIGNITEALEKKGIYDETAIVIMSDNGGPKGPHSSNYPLRGCKKALYEGGTRSYTVLKAPGLQTTNATWSGMIHLVDLMPTLIGMAGGEKKRWMHGYDLWNRIKTFGSSLRKSLLYTYDDHPTYKHWAYREGPWKLIKGKPGKDLGWYPPSNLLINGIAEYVEVDRLGNYSNHYELYNVKNDPEERRDRLKDKPDIVKKLNESLNAFLEEFPVQPYVQPKRNDNWIKDGVINTCSCQPEGQETC